MSTPKTMNYYYNLPQDIINVIENKVEEQYLDQWKNKMKLVNEVFGFVCEIDGYTELLEEGMTYREIIEDVNGMEDGKLTFKGMEYTYYNLRDVVLNSNPFRVSVPHVAQV